MKFPWFRRKKIEPQILPEETRKSLSELIKDYNTWRGIISFENAGKTEPPPDDDLGIKKLKEIEEQIIGSLPDDFQKSVFGILARHKFDITNFLKEEEWGEIFKGMCQKICHFLYHGSPYPDIPEEEPLPVSGEEFFFWLLNQAKTDVEGDRILNIFSAAKTLIEKNNLMGHYFDWKANGASMRLLVIFAGEWAKQSRALVDILCEVEGGENFIKELLNLE